MDRRSFLLNSSLTTLGGIALSKIKFETFIDPKQIGVQLYTVRDAMAKDPIKTLQLIADMGYGHVENAGYDQSKYYGMSRSEFKTLLDDLGLKMHSGHTLTGARFKDKTHTMYNQWEKALEDAAAIDQEYIVLAYIHDFEREDLDGYKRIAELCNKCGEKANEYGVKLAYHNHDFEFDMFGDKSGYDLLLDEVAEENMKFEIDLYWTRKAGVDAIQYFQANPGRFHCWHVKDMDNTEERFFTEVGHGVIDWKKHFNKADLAGLKHFYVEQDKCRDNPPLEAIQISYNYLKSLHI